MKKPLFLFIAILTTLSLSAKKIKFAVDMTGQIISAFGVHVTGDFQEAAGLPLNWDPASVTLTQEGITNIYSTIITIPAFATAVLVSPCGAEGSFLSVQKIP